MPRLSQISDENASPAAAELFSAIKQKVGMTPNLYRVMANEPAVLAANLAMNEALSKGSFSREIREAIALVSAGTNGCDYCASAHTAVSKSLKVDGVEINNRIQGRSNDPKIQAILSFSNAVIASRGFVSDAELQAARDGGLNEGQIVETVANVVANIFTNYINLAAETEIDFPVVSSLGAVAA